MAPAHDHTYCSILWCEGGAGYLPHECCSDEKEKLLKALIMSYWVKDLVQKDKLDTAQVPHLLRVCSEGPVGPRGTSLTFRNACITARSLFILYLFEQSYVVTIFIDLFN